MNDQKLTVEPTMGCEARKRNHSGGWLDWHMETFVKPYLGYIPKGLAAFTNPFSPHEMSVIKNMWRNVKREANGLPVLLAGRDVFIFEVLARREHFPTVFRPDISRLTVDHVKEDYSRHYLFDTGFEGSIPKALKCKFYSMASANESSGWGTWGRGRPIAPDRKIIQTFPRMTGSRSLALKIESTPKYWQRGFYREDKGICQDLSDKEVFERAARLTICIYKDSSPKFSEGQMVAKKKTEIEFDQKYWDFLIE